MEIENAILMPVMNGSASNSGKKRLPVEPFMTGFLEDNKYVGRPVDVLQLKDGSLLVSDDWNGAIYRITYGQKVTSK